jgi:hypothetical protein
MPGYAFPHLLIHMILWLGMVAVLSEDEKKYFIGLLEALGEGVTVTQQTMFIITASSHISIVS